MVRRALPLFYDHGCNFQTFPNPVKIPLSLEEMYGKPFDEHQDFLEYLNAQMGVASDAQGELLVYCRNIAKGLHPPVLGFNQECERELEEEAEEEEQQEIEIEVCSPHSQSSWVFKIVFQNNFTSLFGSVFVPLKSFIKSRLPNFGNISWSENLYCTSNFWKTVRYSEQRFDMSLYLRLVSAMFVFKDSRVVLISLYELYQPLTHWLELGRAKDSIVPARIEQLSRVLKPEQQSFGGKCFPERTEVLTSVQQFCGLVNYSDEEMAVLRSMFRDETDAPLAIQSIIAARHRALYFKRSNLEILCDSL